MLVLQADALERQGITFRATTEILFQNKLFAKGGSFSKQIYQRIVASLQKEAHRDETDCLIIDWGEHFTVWHEVKNLESTADQVSPPVQTGVDRPSNSVLQLKTSPSAGDVVEVQGAPEVVNQRSTAEPTQDLPVPTTPQIKSQESATDLPTPRQSSNEQSYLSAEAPSPKQPRKRKYRGVEY